MKKAIQKLGTLAVAVFMLSVGYNAVEGGYFNNTEGGYINFVPFPMFDDE